MPTPLNFPMTPPGYPNVFLPGYYGDATAQAKLLVGYALNEDMIALNKWVTVDGVDQAIAYYPNFNSSDFVRLKNRTGNDRRWADGAERPTAMQGVRFSNRDYQLERYGESTFIGGLAEEYTQIGPLVVLAQETLASRALTWRSVVGIATVTDPLNYFTTATPSVYDNYFTYWTTFANTFSGAGKPYPAGWFGTNAYSGTIAAPYFKRFTGVIVRELMRRTNNRVRMSDLLMLANPNTLGKLGGTEEMHAYLAQQANSIRVLKGEEPDMDYSYFGVPNPCYGLKVVCDASTVTLGAPYDSTTTPDYGFQQYLLPDDFLAVLTRPGSVAGMRGSRSFSSIMLFQNKSRALKPSTFPDMRSDRTEVAVEDMFTLEMVAPDASWAMGSLLASP